MGIQKWSDTVLLVSLAQEPDMGEELQTTIEMVDSDGCYDVVVDFSEAEIITSSSIAKLLKLRKVLNDCDHKLVLSGISHQTKNVFVITGLDGVFEFVEDKFLGLAGLQLMNN